MKMLYCEDCLDVVVPYPQRRKVRFCSCTRSACWWEDPSSGVFRVWSASGPNAVSVLGLHNSLLVAPYLPPKEDPTGPPARVIEKDVVQDILEHTPDSYLFKRIGQLVIRLRPGASSDTAFSATPDPDAAA